MMKILANVHISPPSPLQHNNKFQYAIKIFCNNKCSSQFSSSPPTQQKVTTIGATDTWRQTDNHSPASKSGRIKMVTSARSKPGESELCAV